MARKRFSYHPDVQKYVRTIVAHEYAERQRVSFLEIDGLNKGRIRALWKADITTADALLNTPADEVARRMSPYCGVRVEWVAGWQQQIADLLKEREGQVRGPLGWEKTPPQDEDT